MKRRLPVDKCSMTRIYSLLFTFIVLAVISCAPPPPPATDKLPAAGLYNNEEGSPVYSMIDNAQRTIDIEIYQMTDPDFVSSIRKAIFRGVKIRVVKEPAPLGDTCRVFESSSDDSDDCKTQKSLMAEIKNNGGAYIAFNKEELCGAGGTKCFLHGKMVIADEKVVMISTGNFNKSNLCNQKQNPVKCNRDYSVVLRDNDVSAALEKIFVNDLAAKRYDLAAILDDKVKNKITVSPLSLEPTLAFIKTAKKSIKIQNQYLKETNMNKALTEAAKNGVKVEIMVASLCSFGKPSERDVKNNSDLFSSFDQAGIQSKMFTVKNMVGGHPGYMHAKTILIDDSYAWVGSVNGSSTALTMNREFGAFLGDAKSIQKLQEVTDKDFINPGAETWQDSLVCKNDSASDDSGGGDN